MLERDIEKELVDATHQAGGRCYKWVSPGRRGVPDRILLLPGKILAFVETKSDRPGARLRPEQVREIQFIRRLGFTVIVVNEPGIAQRLIRRLRQSARTTASPVHGKK